MGEKSIEIPSADEGAVKPWRKWLQGVEEEQHGARACVGEWLEAGASYVLPVGALVVLCDPLPGGEQKRVRIWRVKTDGTVKEERDSTLKNRSAFGTSVRGTMRRLLEKHPVRPGGGARRVTAAPPRPNEREDNCWMCRQPVAAGAGLLVRDEHGRSRARHQPGQCPPPPPRANQRAQPCGVCGGWLEAEEGVLYNAGLARMPVTKARHPGECPPAGERKAAPPRVNGREQECVRCDHVVPAGGGELSRAGSSWIVRHRSGECPPRERLWVISRGVPGGFHPRPERWAPAGTVLRASLFESAEMPFPEDAPGYRRIRDREVSAIVTTVREKRPEYCRDEDGNQPSELIGEDGWYFRILVRPATAQEAADILAQEEQDARRAALEQRRRALFGYGVDDGEIPEQPDLSRTSTVNFGASERRSPHQHWPDDELRVDETSGVVWFLKHNGADGDDWALNNWSMFIARRFPLTTDRRALLADLRAEYVQQSG